MSVADEDLDKDFGPARSPERIDRWEQDSEPESLSTLDADLAERLVRLEQIAQCNLLRHAELAKNYIWAMAPDGSIRIAVEELAIEPRPEVSTGYPRRKGPVHPSEEKKLGHPTLLGGGLARIAGELAFDEFDGVLKWVFNVNSGRYCKQLPPSPDQVERAATIFRNHGLDIVIDDII